jgi:POT family proton-dependent oligopeptide transporter
MPTTWLITVDSVVSVGGLVAVLGFWRLWARRFSEPDEVTKITLGLFLAAGAVMMLVVASQIAAGGHRAAIGWALAFHVINSIAYANIFPVGLALYARASPKSLSGTMIGVYFLHLFAANNLVGWLGGLIEKLPATQFWLLHVGLVTGAAVVFLIAGQLFGQLLAPTGHESSVGETSG